MSGIIQLLHEGQVIQQGKYECISQYNAFLEKYKRLYGKGFSKITINNIPNPAQEKTHPRFKKGSLPETYKKPTFSKNRSWYSSGER